MRVKKKDQAKKVTLHILGGIDNLKEKKEIRVKKVPTGKVHWGLKREKNIAEICRTETHKTPKKTEESVVGKNGREARKTVNGGGLGSLGGGVVLPCRKVLYGVKWKMGTAKYKRHF